MTALHVDARVQVDTDGQGHWSVASVTKCNDDGTVNVCYDDGPSENRVPADYIRLQDAGKDVSSLPHIVRSAPDEPSAHQEEHDEPEGPVISTTTTVPLHPSARVQVDADGRGHWVTASVAKSNEDGTVNVYYEDGTSENRVPADYVRLYDAGNISSPPNIVHSVRDELSACKESATWKGQDMAMLNNTVLPDVHHTDSKQVLQQHRSSSKAGGSGWCEGSLVSADYLGLGFHHPARVTHVHPNGACDLLYEDGLREERVPTSRIDRREASLTRASSISQEKWLPSRQRRPITPGSNRRQSAGAKVVEKASKELLSELARVEVFKSTPEDKNWADSHGNYGESGLFRGMIRRYRLNAANGASALTMSQSCDMPISVFVRCRPMLPHESRNGHYSIVTPGHQCVSESLVLHEPKVLLDLTKAINNHIYTFDNVFGQSSTNRQIYEAALHPMVNHLLNTKGSHGTCFAYGQTGSGKTATMSGLGDVAMSEENRDGLYRFVADEIFSHVAEAAKNGTSLGVRCGFLEIYRSKCFDLLGARKAIDVMEDEHGQQQLVGLQHVDVKSASHFLHLLACSDRATRATQQNENSSRSHAILQITVVERGAESWEDQMQCKLSLIDLAGNEWAHNSQNDDRENRIDGTEINKSLLALKECIRALGSRSTHVPFRGSKLTQVLKDSFVGKGSRTVMIANISPCSASCEQSLNTLRYAQRVKDWIAQQEEHAQPHKQRLSSQTRQVSPSALNQHSPIVSRQSSPQSNRSQKQTSQIAARYQSPSVCKRGNSAAQEVIDAESEDQTRKRTPSEQKHADQVSHKLVNARQALLIAHEAATLFAREIQPEAESLVLLGRGEENTEDFVMRLRAMEDQRRQMTDRVSAALREYDACVQKH